MKRGRTQTRWITDDHGAIAYYRQCSKCRRWFTLDGFAPRRRDPDTGRVMSYDTWCREDRNAAYRRRWAALDPERKRAIEARRTASRKATPERVEQRRRTNREAARRKRARDPEAARRKQREKERQRYARIKADPELHAEHRARERMNYRLRQEARGRTVRPGPAGVIGGYRTSNGGQAGLRLNPEPLRAWLEAAIAQEATRDVDLVGLCKSIGIGDRQLRAILGAEYATVSLHTADRILTAYGRPVVIRSRDLERRLAAWAQGLPGNGTRLLAYLDRAERVAHLADVTLMRLDDLWPELAED